MGLKEFASSIPVIGGLFDNSDQEAMDELKRNQALYAGLQTPDFAQYKPDQYSVVGQYDPAMADATTIQQDPELQEAQQNVLSKLAGLSTTGLSDVDQAGYQQARNVGEQEARAGTGAALQNALDRGAAGSGLEFAAREQAAQGGADRANQAALQQAAQAAQMRAAYTNAYGSALSAVRGQNFGENAANANILNQFNMANTQNKNQAQQYNLGNAQGVANANVTNANQAQQYNNQMKQQAYQDQYQKTAGEAGANSGMAGGYAAQNAANTDQRNKNTQTAGQLAGLM